MIEQQKGNEEKITGCLLGTAVGDSIGLCYEGLSKRRQRKMYPELKGHRFLFGKGMVSDDTEHTIMVACAILESGGDISVFIKKLSWKFRFWLLGLPAGIGMATLKACLKLCIGFPGTKSGVYSAGNGPAMRSAIIGVIYGHDMEKMKEMVRLSTKITHTDPKAEFGALAVALAASMAADGQFSPDEYCLKLENLLGQRAEEFLTLVRKARKMALSDKTTECFAETIGLDKGVSGYIYHTVPVVLYGWFKQPKNYQDAIMEIIRCGGDTDTTSAILGSIIGAGVGKVGIPEEWIDNLWEWPGTVRWMEELGRKLTKFSLDNEIQSTPELNPLFIIMRNIFFMLLVLLHGLRRLLPPY